MKCVITGSAGFVANYTISVLQKAGYEIVKFDLVNGLDVCSEEALRCYITPGCKVLHLAAIARFADADTDPPEAYRTNVGGTAMLLKVCQDIGVDRVVLSSTGSVYMPVWNVPIREHHPIAGNSHYGNSKAQQELMMHYHRVPFVILRYAHLYGPLKRHGGLIDAFLTRVKRGETPILYGGRQSNDFTYIKDVAEANKLALETPHTNEIFNIGTGEEITSEQVFEILKELVNYDGPIDYHPLRVVDASRFVMDISKAQRLLGYNPKWTLRSGLEDMSIGKSTK